MNQACKDGALRQLVLHLGSLGGAFPVQQARKMWLGVGGLQQDVWARLVRCEEALGI